MYLFLRYFVLLLTIAVGGCQFIQSPKLFRELSSAQTGVTFTNQLTYTDSLSVLEFEYMFNGAGVALCDINNDKLLDIFFTGNMVSSRLYLNKGGLKFEDITEKAGLKTAGWAYGVSVVDINQDGFQDIYVSKAGHRGTPAQDMHNLFFINNGNLTFTESAAAMHLDDDGYDIQSAFFDYDHDGDLDMYLLRNAIVNFNRNASRPKQTDGQASSTGKLFRNEGIQKDGLPTFTDVSREAGLTIEGFGLGVNICDLNNDNWPDIYVSNDFKTNDLVWINNQNGTFTNQASKLLRHETYNGMGNDIADFNNDGLADIMVVDMLPPDNKRWKLTMMGNNYDEFQQDIAYGYEPQYVRNTLQLNNGNGPDGLPSFSEIGQLAGVQATEWSWAPLFADYDNDGWKDLFVANGYRQDITNLDFILYGKKALFMGTPEANRKERLDELQKFPGIQVPNCMYRNNGSINPGDLTFTDVSKQWGITQPTYTNGAAYGDLDNDGDLDLVLNNLDQEASIVENQTNILTPDHAFLRLNFNGPTGNRDGVGAKVWLWQKGHMQYNYFSPYRGYLSTVEPFLHFGLQKGAVDSLKVEWPDGKQQVLIHPLTNQLLTLAYNNAQASLSKKPEQPPMTPLFVECEDDYQIQYQHKEDNFVDYRTQPILTHLNSHNGPGLAVGDVNSDNLDDFYVGGAAGSQGRLFIQQSNGTFHQQVVSPDSVADDMGALFFDADGDGDQDLYVVSGGVSLAKEGDRVYQHRLYLNDGQGRFSRLMSGLPKLASSGSSVIASDYDHDGDLDLFVGGRVCPNDYPLSPASFLIRNDSQKGRCRFSDATQLSGLPTPRLGMVTSALWTDFDNDTWTDLIVVGEFMPIRFFKNSRGHFTEITEQTGLQHTAGWWNSLVGGDFDNDGDIDYLVGNLGLNSRYKASPEDPICLYASDYDKNGRLDPIMCHFVDGEEYIVHARDDINKQMAAMRARFKNYTDYAEATFKESFRSDELADAYVLKSERLQTSYLENKGNGHFAFRALPQVVQLSPVFGMQTGDFDRDGQLDALLVGNSFSTEVNAGRYDAQGGLLLKGDGKGNFRADRSQFNLTGDNKSIAQLQGANHAALLLVSSNNTKLRAFRVQQPIEQQIALLPTDAYALLTDQWGRKQRQEFYYGHSYLSQQSRHLAIPAHVRSVVVYSTNGQHRLVTQPDYARQ